MSRGKEMVLLARSKFAERPLTNNVTSSSSKPSTLSHNNSKLMIFVNLMEMKLKAFTRRISFVKIKFINLLCFFKIQQVFKKIEM